MSPHFNIEWHERVTSTNTCLRERAERTPGLPSGTVLAAREQTGGRGRFDRVWLSGKNENLTFSIYFRTESAPRRLPAASMAAALAVADLLAEAGIQPTLKWPNDVLVNGKKICGILSETVQGGIIIGIGLNVNMESTGHIDQPATSMLIESGTRRDREQLLPLLLEKMAPHLAAWATLGFAGIRKNWEARIPNLGQLVRVRDGVILREGLLAGFGEDGELLLQNADSAILPVWSGELGR